MDKVQVVPVALEHIDGIMIVEHLSFKIPWSKNAFIEEITKNKFARYVIAMADGQVVGYAGMWEVCDEGHITNVAVHPEYRKKGIGGKLLEGLMRIAKQDGITKLTLEVRESNGVAKKLYCKYGFEEGGLRKSYYADNGENAVIMWKNNI